MAIRITGPVDADFLVYQEGVKLDNWHLDAFNNSCCTVDITLRVYKITYDPSAEYGITEIGHQCKTIKPGWHQFLTVSMGGEEHTMAVIEHPLDRDDIFVTVSIRDTNDRNVIGTIFRHEDLIDIEYIRC